MNKFPIHIVLLFTIFYNLSAQSTVKFQTISDPIREKTAPMQKYEGFFTYFWDETEGKLWLEIDKWDTEFIYITYLSEGIGSNDIGLDRGQLGGTHVVKFKRFGPKVLMIEPNYTYRAVSKNDDEKKAVQESFAQSVLWGFKIEVSSGSRVLVDASNFFLRDVHNVGQHLADNGQGDYTLESDRSVFSLPRTKNFPLNTEIDVLLTLTGTPEGDLVRRVVPSPAAITVHEHHSFVQLPDNQYRPRVYDPRAGYFGIEYYNYAALLGQPLIKRFIARHRLFKKDPGAEMSEAVTPIVYYVDRGAPEPVRSALLDGARWWEEAFEACGYKDAFQVKLLPEGVDPLDVRYNVIQWVHRSTRGWSYGNTVIDPRTGEIIKGLVTLGSLRLRQDYMIAEGILSPYTTRQKSDSAEMQALALARLRQLSAHEVGHTLGLAHNFAASAQGRISVMDYPYPYITLNSDNTLDLSKAYTRGVGAWDITAIAYGYQDFTPGRDEKQALNMLIEAAIDSGFIFISDQDARPSGGAHATAHLWDNGKDAVNELTRIMALRSYFLDNFSEKAIPYNRPMARLAEVLVPVYLFHRYQVEAAAKILGGAYYTYALRGDGQPVLEIIAGEQQRRALSALLNTINTKALLLPERILNLIPPKPEGYLRNNELFDAHTAVIFDPLAAAESAAEITVSLLLHPARAARLIEYHARNAKNPGFAGVLDQMLAHTWLDEHYSGYEGEIQKTVDNVVLENLFVLALDPFASELVKSITDLKIEELNRALKEKTEDVSGEALRAHYFHALQRIGQFRRDPNNFIFDEPLRLPAGSPIGSGSRY